MQSASFFISPKDLWTAIGDAAAPQVIDARRREVYDAAPHVLPTATWQDAKKRGLDRLARPRARRRRRLQGRP